MSEIVKSGIFIGVAAVVIAAATYLQLSSAWDESQVTEVALFPEIKDDTSEIAKIEIKHFDEETNAVQEFRVNKTDAGEWVIGSRFGYPADGVRHGFLIQTVSRLAFLGESISSDPGQHSDFGVMEPAAGAAQQNPEGMGMLITLANDAGLALAEIIVGKSDATRGGVYYIRKPGEDLVFEAKFEAAVISANFADWINTSLLSLAIPDVAGVNYNNPATAPDIDATTLDLIVRLLTSLQILEVQRLPADVAEFHALRDESSPGGADAQTPPALQPSTIDLLGNRGFSVTENTIATDEEDLSLLIKRGAGPDGVVYRLQFGDVVGEAGQPPPPGDEANPMALARRYVLVSVGFDQSLLPVPEKPPILDAAADQETDDPEQAAQRRQAEIEYRTKVEEYDRLVASGRDHAVAAQQRFSGWLFEINDAAYQQLKKLRESTATQDSQNADSSGGN